MRKPKTENRILEYALLAFIVTITVLAGIATIIIFAKLLGYL